nr:PREDICTED: cyclic AMP-responsive element-binding protein 3-like protein 3-A [Paralichthys olivaceus]
MEHYPDQGCDGIELLDWLFDQNDGILCHEETEHHGNHHTWPIQDQNMLQPPDQADDDFLNALLSGNDSVSGSPLWSPSPSDSGISEDPPSDQMDSPQRPESPHRKTLFFSKTPQTKAALEANVPIDLNGWESSGFLAGRARITQYPSDVHRPQLSSGFPLTVKDLLLSGTPEPFYLCCTKTVIFLRIRDFSFFFCLLHTISSRMAACNAHNQELQRKVSQLEKCNMSLMEQLRRLQALFMNTSNKPAQTGTCVLVLLLSLSLILFPSLKPFPDSKVSQGDFSPVRIQSRSLQNLQASRVLRVIDTPFSSEDESEPLHRHFPGDHGLEDMNTLMEKLAVNEEHSSLMTVSLNSSRVEEVGHFHVDPITGHIATVTLDPHRSAKLRPHADDM